ncbi:MAG: DUF1592 domain-containing protein [Pirellulaceae bacterium]
MKTFTTLSTVCTIVCVFCGSLNAADKTLSFAKDVAPVLKTFCYDCHNKDVQEANTRIDNLNPNMINGPDAERWHHVLNMINLGKMPPKDSEQPDEDSLVRMIEWIQGELTKAIELRQTSNRAVMRRLTTTQYTNSLQQLLGVTVDFGNALPEDAKSQSGFSNNASVLQATPLHLEYYQRIAREALDQAIFTEKPEVVRYRIQMGTEIGRSLPNEKKAGRFGGYVSQPVDTNHLIPYVLDNIGNEVAVDPSAREGRYANVLQNLGIGMRGSDRNRYEMAANGMLLDSAVPHQEVAPGSWHGPSPNLKMLIRRDFPAKGTFALRVRAAQVDSKQPSLQATYGNVEPQSTIENSVVSHQQNAIVLSPEQAKKLTRVELKDGFLVTKDKSNPNRAAQYTLNLDTPDVFHIDIIRSALTDDPKVDFNFELVQRNSKLNRKYEKKNDDQNAVLFASGLGIMSLPKGETTILLKWNADLNIGDLALTPLATDHKIRRQREEQFAAYQSQWEQDNARTAALQVSLGNRTDDGQDAQGFDRVQPITTAHNEFLTYEFIGRLENLPTPQVDLNEMSDLANIMVLTVWNGDFIKDRSKSGSRVIVESMEFEAPYFPEWPPASHKAVFFDSPNSDNEDVYTREVLESFMAKAFRRPVEKGEVDLYHEFWLSICGDHETYEASVKETLVAVLCSPKFLFMAESDAERKTKTQREHELASRLSYFLWNSPPDERLYELASKNQLRDNLEDEIQRMIAQPQVIEFSKSFCDQWLKLYRHKEMLVDVRKYPAFTRFVKEDMAKETYHFFTHALQNNLKLSTLIDSDFVMVNQNLAEYYGIPDVIGAEFRAVPVSADIGRGGLLTQGSFLSGHSDGTQAHPIKRAVWLMERILGESPPPPPPNVPDLEQKEKNANLTIAQQLAIHRDNVSCKNCHQKLDPYGLVFEDFNGAGLLDGNAGNNPSTKVVLPTGVTVNGVAQMKQYILESEKLQYTRSLVEHLLAYALGRDMSFVDEQQISQIVDNIIKRGSSFHIVMEEVITSPLFLQEQRSR